jgi:SigmaK-factor processing regulatory protein BofA
MELSGVTFLVLVLAVAVVIGIFVVKNIIKLVINSVLGLLILFFVNYFHILGLVGKPDIPINAVTFLICLFGGIPGALLLILLQLLGVTL